MHTSDAGYFEKPPGQKVDMSVAPRKKRTRRGQTHAEQRRFASSGRRPRGGSATLAEAAFLA